MGVSIPRILRALKAVTEHKGNSNSPRGRPVCRSLHDETFPRCVSVKWSVGCSSADLRISETIVQTQRYGAFGKCLLLCLVSFNGNINLSWTHNEWPLALQRGCKWCAFRGIFYCHISITTQVNQFCPHRNKHRLKSTAKIKPKRNITERFPNCSRFLVQLRAFGWMVKGNSFPCC